MRDSSSGEGRAIAVMIAMGFYPAAHACAVALLLVAPWLAGAPPATSLLGVALLYVAPPLAARIVGTPLLDGEHRAQLGSSAFLRWWALGQFQMIFNRLVFLEEALRLLPGLYSAWLRLWGARIGRRVFWSPRVFIADRSLVDVGEGAVVGIGTTIVSHMIARGPADDLELLLATVCIGANTVVGGFSTLGPGARIADGEAPPATTVLPPFWQWERGRRRPRVLTEDTAVPTAP